MFIFVELKNNLIQMFMFDLKSSLKHVIITMLLDNRLLISESFDILNCYTSLLTKMRSNLIFSS